MKVGQYAWDQRILTMLRDASMKVADWSNNLENTLDGLNGVAPDALWDEVFGVPIPQTLFTDYLNPTNVNYRTGMGLGVSQNIFTPGFQPSKRRLLERGYIEVVMQPRVEGEWSAYKTSERCYIHLKLTQIGLQLLQSVQNKERR